MSKKFFYIYIIILFLLSCFFITNTNKQNLSWPNENYKTITSYFGFRIHPTTFKESYHSGIDIGIPEGEPIYSICSGQIVFTGFNGAYGYSIIVKNNNLEILYGHVSPNFIVSSNNYILAKDIIGNVGPKYIPSSPYLDSNGKPTNGKTTGPHLHLTIKKDGIAVNPLDYF